MSQTRPRVKDGSERRSPLYRYAGHALAVVSCLLFALVFGVGIYKSLAWQEVNFRSALILNEDYCKASAAVAATSAFPNHSARTELSSLKIPHPNEVLRQRFEGARGEWFHIDYLCKVPVSVRPNPAGLTYLHTGWISGDRIEVWLNGSLRAEWSGADKAVVPLTSADVALPELPIEILVSARSAERPGLSGLQPMALASGVVANAAILGLETELSTGRNLFYLLPSAILGLLLAFGWGYGVRLRLLLVGLVYFGVCTLRAMLTQFSDIWPWSADSRYILQAAASITVSGSFVTFGMELLGVFKRAIYPALIIVCILVTTMAFVLLLFIPQPLHMLSPILMFSRLAVVLALTGLVVVASVQARQKRPKSRLERRVAWAFLGISTLFAGATAADLVLILTGSATRLAPTLDILMPVFAGGVLFFALAMIEKHWHAERAEREVLQNALALGASAQRLLLPQQMVGRFGRFRHESFYRPAGTMSGDWLCQWQAGDGELRLLLGDVVGKGPQAALGTTAIAAIIADCRLSGDSVERCIERVNEALLATFSGYITTTFMALVLRREGEVTLYNCGGIGWFLRDGKTGDISQHRVPGSILGMEATAKIGKTAIELTAHSILMSFSDGVCDGARGVRKLIQGLQAVGPDASPASIFETAVHAGEGTTMTDDQSMLVVMAD